MTAGANPDMEDKDRREKVEKWEHIRSEIRKILMSKWDPIGVSDVPEAADEYDNYIDGVYHLLKDRATDTEIAEYLRRIEVDRMGLMDLDPNPLLPVGFRGKAVTALQRLRPFS